MLNSAALFLNINFVTSSSLILFCFIFLQSINVIVWATTTFYWTISSGFLLGVYVFHIMCVHWFSNAFNYAPLIVHGDVNWEGVSRNSCQGHVPKESANNATANPFPSNAV